MEHVTDTTINTAYDTAIANLTTAIDRIEATATADKVEVLARLNVIEANALKGLDALKA